MVAFERPAECGVRLISDFLGNARYGLLCLAEMATGKRHTPGGEVTQGRLANTIGKAAGECRSR